MNAVALVPTPEDQRKGPRRATDHTPEDCPKLNNVQVAMDAVNKRLDDGHKRMCSIEKSITDNHKSAEDFRKRFEEKLDKNAGATDEVLEIVTALKGFVKVAAVIGKVIAWGAAIAAPLIAIWYTIFPSK